MNNLHLLRIPVDPPRLLRFAAVHGITQEDETLGYTLHAWLAALFGAHAPKPFRYFEHRQELLAYATEDAATLVTHAQAFAKPDAWAVLGADGVAGKPMPTAWRVGQRLRLEVLACPTSRQGDEEKDVYLRALDRLGDKAPARGEVYQAWFERQWGSAVQLANVELLGMRARVRMLRRARDGSNLPRACGDRPRLRVVERPEALFAANAVIIDPECFQTLLARGIGRHRAFGYGMVLLAPPR
jgi:CRISPR system Cascade subunit CasE